MCGGAVRAVRAQRRCEAVAAVISQLEKAEAHAAAEKRAEEAAERKAEEAEDDVQHTGKDFRVRSELIPDTWSGI